MVDAQIKTFTVKLIKSTIGCTKKQRECVKALGLRRINSTKQLVDNPCTRGLVNKVNHLVEVIA
jgi:large subunit ribosomal protein L30